MTDDNRNKFSYIAERYNQLIKFYNVEKICAAEINEIKNFFAKDPLVFKRYSIASTFRILIPKIFPTEMKKLIYLDADTIINLDISELWQIPLEDKTLAAVPESFNGMFIDSIDECKYSFLKAGAYFNSGVLLINLEKFNANGYEKMLAGAKFLKENTNIICPDQLILNYCFNKNFVKLPVKFNYFVRDSRLYGNIHFEKLLDKAQYFISDNRSYSNFPLDNCIYHYIDRTLQTDMHDNFNRLWFKYFVKTPYFNQDVLQHFDEGIRQLNINSRNFAANISAIMAGKQRSFFVNATNFDNIKKVFSVKDDEEIISAKGKQSLNELINLMRQANGTKVYFIVINGYDVICDKLKKAGFIEYKDFLDGRIFLSEIHGVPLDTHFLIKDL